MSAPALLKTWQIEGDNLVALSDINTERRTLLLGIVNKLIGFGSNPMTVIGSGNVSASGMDAVNRWSTIADITNNSWIVLQQANVNAKFQICFFCNSGWPSGTPAITIVVSRLAGFGTANGGTNGSTSARPTATDEDITYNAASFPKGAGSCAWRFYVWQATDGTQTRVLVRDATAGTWYCHWFFGKPRNPRTLWTNPVIYWMKTAAVIGDPFAFASLTAYLNTTKVDTIRSQTARYSAISQDNNWEGANYVDTFRMYLNSFTLAGAKGGIIGELFDTRCADPQLGNGTRMPYGGPYTWCSFADTSQNALVLPWDNTTTPKFSAAP